jgi:hypothetical protein
LPTMVTFLRLDVAATLQVLIFVFTRLAGPAI